MVEGAGGQGARGGGSMGCMMEHVNSAFVKMLRTIGFDKGYEKVRGGGVSLMRRGISIWIF